MHFLDNHAVAGDCFCRRFGHRARVAVHHRCDAEIDAEGDTLRFQRPRRRGHVTAGLERSRHRIERMRAGFAFEHQRAVGDVARHRPLDRQRAVRLLLRARHHAGRGPQAHRRAITRRRADAAAEIAAGGEPDLPARQRRRRAARRSARRHARVPRVARHAEHLVEGVAAGGEFRQVRFGDDQRAVGFEPLHDDVGRFRDALGVDARTRGAAHALDVGVVLDRDRQAVKVMRRRRLRRRLHQAPGAITRALEAKRRQRVQRRLGFGDARGGRIDHFEWRDLALPEQRDRRGRRQPAQFIHAELLSSDDGRYGAKYNAGMRRAAAGTASGYNMCSCRARRGVPSTTTTS